MKWGIKFPNSKFNIVINARLEEVTQKPLFKGLIESHRCVIAINGYYEWSEKTGQAYLFKPKEK